MKDLPTISGRPRTAAERLMAANLPLIGYVMGRRFPSLLTGDDRQAEATAAASLALWKAATRYDPAQGKFSTYAVYCIQGELLRHLGNIRAQDRLPCVSLDAPFGEGGDRHGLISADEIAGGPTLSRQSAEAQVMADAGRDRLLQGVPASCVRVLLLVHEDGLTLTQAGAALGVSTQRAAQLHKQGIEAIVSRHSAGVLTEYRGPAECRERRMQMLIEQRKKRKKAMEKRGWRPSTGFYDF